MCAMLRLRGCIGRRDVQSSGSSERPRVCLVVLYLKDLVGPLVGQPEGEPKL